MDKKHSGPPKLSRLSRCSESAGILEAPRALPEGRRRPNAALEPRFTVPASEAAISELSA